MAAAQPSAGHLDGHINGPTGHGLEGVSVVETTGRFSTLSGADGHFSLTLPLGEYTLVTRSLSHQEQRRTVVLSAETPRLTVNFTLQPTQTALQEVEVLGRQETTYVTAAREMLRLCLLRRRRCLTTKSSFLNSFHLLKLFRKSAARPAERHAERSEASRVW